MEKEYFEIKSYADFEELVDKKVCLIGKIAQIPYQHPIAPATDGSETISYFDLDLEYQMVIYYKDDFFYKEEEKDKKYKLFGILTKLEDKGSGFSEYQLRLDKFEAK